MGFLDSLLTGVSGLTSLGGLVRNVFGNAEARARQERENQINSLGRLGTQDYLTGTGNDARTLYAGAGAGADAISALTGRLGDSLAAGGVYNASTVAGAGLNAGREEAASLAYLASQLARQRQENLMANQKAVAGLRLGNAEGDIANAKQDRNAAAGGFASFLGSLSQYNNARTGVTQQQQGVPTMNGTENKLDYLSSPARFPMPQAPRTGQRSKSRYPGLSVTPGYYG